MSRVIEVCGSALRGSIIAAPGKKLVIADYSNIEGRVLAWLAGEQWKLDAFAKFDRTGKWEDDLYNVAYGRSFGISPAGVTKNQRQIGKVQELALGFEGGVGAFVTFAITYRIDLDELAAMVEKESGPEIWRDSEKFLAWYREQGRGQYGLSDKTFIACNVLKSLWRSEHPKIAKYWKSTQNACVNAIQSPGITFSSSMHKIRRDGSWLRIRLPSGRYLCYPEIDYKNNVITYGGKNQFSKNKWCRLSTYSGKLVENITQATARDVMAWSMPILESRGYEIVLTTHDEIIAETLDIPEFNADHMGELMCVENSWNKGLPLKTSGFEAYRYRKD